MGYQVPDPPIHQPRSLVDDGREFFERVTAFKQRTFTGEEVLAIADFLGVGVGATLVAANRLGRT